MHRDIRSYFASKSTTSKEEITPKGKTTSKVKQRKRVIDSDSDDASISKTEESKKTKLSKKAENKQQESKLKPVSLTDVFGSENIKRSVKKTVQGSELKKEDKTRVTKKSDLKEELLENNFNASWDQIDQLESKYFTDKNQSDHNISDINIEAQSSGKRKSSSSEENLPTSQKKFKNSKNGANSEVTVPSTSKNSRSELDKEKTEDSNFTNKTPEGKRNQKNDSSSNENPLKCTNIDSTPTHSKHIDQEISLSAEKKKELYVKYLNRVGPKNPGSKVIPEGLPESLCGLVFVITGVLDSLERDEASDLIKKCGGHVTSSVSRRTSYIIVGDDPGPSKMEKAEKFGTKQLDEDGLLNLIKEKSKGMEKQQLANNLNKQHSVKNELNKQETVKQVRETLPTKSSDLAIYKFSATKACNQKLSNAGNGSSVSDNIVHSESSLWVDKYRPATTKQIIGQQGEKSAVKKLTKWLENWHKSRQQGKKIKPSPWAKDDDGSFYKAALLSGPPGVGKTTTAHLVAKELGFDVVEFNASDTRSKKLLHNEVSELLSSKSLRGYMTGKIAPTAKHVLIMDEVDGMAGNEDRGGIQELIQLIKTAHIPIICMCNDRNNPKIRSLVNYCFDLRFSKPRLEQIKGAMMSVCFKEGIKISPDVLTDIITCANQDIRQVLNNLSMWSVNSKNLSSVDIKTEAQKSKKEFKLGPWDVLKKVFSPEDHKKMSIHDKSDLFFYDYNISPLFVQENYLNVSPVSAGGDIIKTLELVSQTADSISIGDTIEKVIRSNSSWGLLPVQAMFSSVFPGEFMKGYMRSQINFPSWLGKNSRANKFDRLTQELQMHMRLAVSGNKGDLSLDYLQYIRNAIVLPLVKNGMAGVPTALDVLKKHFLLREDIESILELSSWPNQKDPMSMVESKVKAALTRAYNKEGVMIPYAVNTSIKKRTVNYSDEFEGGDGELDDVEEDEDDIKLDGMIKTTTKKTVKNEQPSSKETKKNKVKGKKKTTK